MPRSPLTTRSLTLALTATLLTAATFAAPLTTSLKAGQTAAAPEREITELRPGIYRTRERTATTA